MLLSLHFYFPEFPFGTVTVVVALVTFPALSVTA